MTDPAPSEPRLASLDAILAPLSYDRAATAQAVMLGALSAAVSDEQWATALRIAHAEAIR